MTTRLELLEKLVNRSTLSTQRVTHKHVITVGEKVLTAYDEGRNDQFYSELKKLISDLQLKAEQEKKEALADLEEKLNKLRDEALYAQKTHYEETAKRVAKMRDRLEAERIDELTMKMNREKEEALKLLQEQALREKEEAIKSSCDELAKKLGREHRLDKELCIATSLKRAREGFKVRMEEVIQETTVECMDLAAQEAARVAKLHEETIQWHEMRYQQLKDKYDLEHAHRKRVESDFLTLQTDYQRFMDYTDGRYHSDYMMSLRRYGMNLAEKRLSDVSEYQEKPINQILLPKK